MIFWSIIGIALYFIAPLSLVLWLCYSILDLDIPVELISAITILIQVAFFVQILYWLYM